MKPANPPPGQLPILTFCCGDGKQLFQLDHHLSRSLRWICRFTAETSYPISSRVLGLPRFCLFRDGSSIDEFISYRNRSQGVAVVGIGSFIFHASLLYEAQLADELPMVLVASYSLFILSDLRKGFRFGAGRGVVSLVAFNTLFPIS